MKKFISEFKKFIMRGNVIDMAVGVIVGSSFTAIVNGMSNFILKPIINWILALIFGANSLSEVFTMLKPAYDADGALDLANSIYIDWGAFINAVINFFLVAFVLFTILKVVNKVREDRKELSEKIAEKTLDRTERRELRAHGVNIRDKKAVAAYFAEKKRLADEAAAKAKAEADEKARLEREQNPTTEELLKKILAVISK